jgi:hypothetical protein
VKPRLTHRISDRSVYPALYGQGKKPSIGVIEDAIRVSWELHLRERLIDCQPSAIVVIGKVVHRILEHELAKIPAKQIEMISQPTAFASAAAKLQDLKTLYAVCSRYAP